MKWLPNPYAIAQQVTNTPDIASILRSGGKVADSFLRETFLSGRRQKTMIGALAIFERIARMFDGPITLSQAVEQSQRIWAAESYTAAQIGRVLPSVLPILSAVSSDAFTDADELIIDKVSYLDPVQGDVGDCYLISAMIALAWAKKIKLTRRLNSAGFNPPADRSFAWKFHDDTGADGDRTKVTGRLMMAGNLPRYARSSSPVEDWPSLLEKAYVVQVCGANVVQGEPSQPNYKSIDAMTEGSMPQRACQALLGGVIQGELLDSNAGRKIFLQDGRLETESGVMSKPVMAWTKMKEREEEIDPDADDVWETTGLFPRHAYAVLGTMLSNNTVKHVVLRNPHGADTDPDRDGYHAGPWDPDGGPSVLLNKDGVFAISRKLFYENFEDIGWVDH